MDKVAIGFVKQAGFPLKVTKAIHKAKQFSEGATRTRAVASAKRLRSDSQNLRKVVKAQGVIEGMAAKASKGFRDGSIPGDAYRRGMRSLRSARSTGLGRAIDADFARWSSGLIHKDNAALRRTRRHNVALAAGTTAAAGAALAATD